MSEHLDALERLTGMRDRGVLTNEEFEQEKAKLLEKSSSAGRTISPLKQYLALSALGIGAVGAFFLARAALFDPGPTADGDGASVAAQSIPEGFFAPASIWKVTSTRDPIADTAIETAVALLEGKQFDIEVSVTCSDAGELRYGFTSFDKAGEPAQMRSDVYWNNFGGGSRIPFQLKAGEAPAVTLGDSNPAYNNQVELRSTSIEAQRDLSSDLAHQVAASDYVVARMFMLSGEETVEFSQTDTALRSLLDACIARREARWADLNAERTQFLQEQERLAEQERQARIRENVKQGRPANADSYGM